MDRRLLSTEAQGERTFVGVAHEAFLVNWPPLKDEIDAQQPPFERVEWWKAPPTTGLRASATTARCCKARNSPATVDIGAELEPVTKSDGRPASDRNGA